MRSVRREKKDYACKCNCGRDGTREEGFGS